MEPNNHFGLRFCCIIMLWFSLSGALLSDGISQRAFISALVLFLLPLSLDYYSHMPKEEKNKKRRSIGIWSTLIITSILFGIDILAGFDLNPFLNFEFSFMGITISMKFIIWIATLYYLYLALIDWLAYGSPEEVEHRKRLTNMIREEAEEKEDFNDRVEYHRNNKKYKRKQLSVSADK